MIDMRNEQDLIDCCLVLSSNILHLNGTRKNREEIRTSSVSLVVLDQAGAGRCDVAIRCHNHRVVSYVLFWNWTSWAARGFFEEYIVSKYLCVHNPNRFFAYNNQKSYVMLWYHAGTNSIQTNLHPWESHLLTSRRGDTALYGAAREGHCAVVEKLISAGAKVDASGFQGLERVGGGGSFKFYLVPWAPQTGRDTEGEWQEETRCFRNVMFACLDNCFLQWSWSYEHGDFREGRRCQRWGNQSSTFSTLSYEIWPFRPEAISLYWLPAYQLKSSPPHSLIPLLVFQHFALLPLIPRSSKALQLCFMLFPMRPLGVRGRTSLLRAAGNGHIEVVELLLKSGASVEAQNDNGDGPRTDGTTNLVWWCLMQRWKHHNPLLYTS